MDVITIRLHSPRHMRTAFQSGPPTRVGPYQFQNVGIDGDDVVITYTVEPRNREEHLAVLHYREISDLLKEVIGVYDPRVLTVKGWNIGPNEFETEEGARFKFIGGSQDGDSGYWYRRIWYATDFAAYYQPPRSKEPPTPGHDVL